MARHTAGKAPVNSTAKARLVGWAMSLLQGTWSGASCIGMARAAIRHRSHNIWGTPQNAATFGGVALANLVGSRNVQGHGSAARVSSPGGGGPRTDQYRQDALCRGTHARSSIGHDRLPAP